MKKQYYECGFKVISDINIQINLNFILLCVFLILYDIEFTLLFPVLFNFTNIFFFSIYFIFTFCFINYIIFILWYSNECIKLTILEVSSIFTYILYR